MPIPSLIIHYLVAFNLFFPVLPAQSAKMHNPKQLLVTGWYYITEQPNNYKRQADKTNQVYYIDPDPIITVKHFKKIELSDSLFMNKKYAMLMIYFDDPGTKAWSIATNKAVHSKLAFIIDNKLIITPTIKQPVNNGLADVIGDNYSKQALAALVSELDSEMK